MRRGTTRATACDIEAPQLRVRGPHDAVEAKQHAAHHGCTRCTSYCHMTHRPHTGACASPNDVVPITRRTPFSTLASACGAYLRLRVLIERRRRLVQQQDARVADESAPNKSAVFLRGSKQVRGKRPVSSYAIAMRCFWPPLSSFPPVPHCVSYALSKEATNSCAFALRHAACMSTHLANETRAHARTHARMHTNTRRCIHAGTCLHAYAHTRRHTRTRAREHIHRTRTHAHKDKYTHTHTCVPPLAHR